MIRSRPALLAVLICGISLPAFAITHHVDDFRLDSAAAASDTALHLDRGWGDSLLIDAKFFTYTTVLNRNLSDAAVSHNTINGYLGASPVATSTSRYNFKVGYLSWENDIVNPNASPPAGGIAVLGNIVIRKVLFSPDTIAIDPISTYIASKENTPTNSAPYSFNFAAEADHYSAYWGSLSNNVALRRTTHKDTIPGSDFSGKNLQDRPIGAPPHVDTSAGYGMITACQVPGSNGSRTVVAVEGKDVAGNKVRVRWEDIDNNTSTSVLSPLRPMIPYDMAVGADSAGNALVLWREGNAMYAVSYNNAHAQILDTVKLQNTVFYNDVGYLNTQTPAHSHRPYSVASMTRNNFIIVYSRAGVVYYQTLRVTGVPLSAPILGPETPLSDPSVFAMFPDIAVTADRVVVAWFQKAAPPAFDKLIMAGTVFPKVGNDIDTSSNTYKRQDFALDTLDFTGQPPSWRYVHYPKTASVAMDDRGNVMAAYDNGYNAKFSLVRNTPTYHDSAVFQSRFFKVRSPSLLAADNFIPGVDSAKFLSLVGIDTARIKLELETAKDSLFTISPSGFQTLPAPKIVSDGYYRYRVTLKSTVTDLRHSTPKLKSLDIDINAKPRLPVVDSIQVGDTAETVFNPLPSKYRLLRRKDALKLKLSGFDLDDGTLTFRLNLGNRLLKSIAGTKTSAGHFTGTINLTAQDFQPIDTLMNTLILVVTSTDDRGWVSKPDTLRLDYSNIAPTQAISLIQRKAAEVARVYLPFGGATDTLTPAAASTLVAQVGDTLNVRVAYTDGNDDSVTTTWIQNGNAPVIKRLLAADTLKFRIPVDTVSPLIDTITIMVGDKDSTQSLRFLVRSNRMPSLDSVGHTGYKNRDSTWVFGHFDEVRNFAADSDLVVPAGLPTLLEAGISDADRILGDLVQLHWNAWKKTVPTCAAGDLTCYQIADSGQGLSFTHTFSVAEEYITLRVTDLSGAFRERKVRLKYPVVDTGNNTSTGLAATALTLNGKIGFILGSGVVDTTVTATIKSAGTTALRIDSVKTGRDDQAWLGFKLSWVAGSPGVPKIVGSTGSTAGNALKPGDSVLIDPIVNTNLNISFKFTSTALAGDSILSDTLFLYTNDFANPVLKIPYRMKYDDLPRIRLGVPGSKPAGAPEGFNAAGLPAYMPARSKIAFGFTETVKITDSNAIQVYSYLDSLKDSANWRPIKGHFDYIRKHTGLVKKTGLAKAAAAGDLLADTVVFTPEYDRPSSALKVKPAPGFFIYRDIIHIGIRNLITDTAGNNLDLRLNRSRQALGAFDTVFQAKVDTGFFAVAQTLPAAGQSGWDPDQTIRIRFNRKLAQRPPAGIDTLTLLNLNSLRGDSNRYLGVTSVFQGTRRYNFQFLALEDGDSTLVFKTRPRFPALDTVTVTLSGGLLDTSGLSLDGNGNRFPDWLYAPSDTADQFSFSFQTRDQDFYVFPNPYRFSDSRHREKGAITFKNLNTLPGFVKGQEVVLRIHTMTGDLVYNSRDASPATGSRTAVNTSLDWDMKNRAGNTVGTGVYIFSLMSGDTKLIKKGKVAVVR